MQNLDYVKNSVLAPLGLPGSILDGTSGNKWSVFIWPLVSKFDEGKS